MRAEFPNLHLLRSLRGRFSWLLVALILLVLSTPMLVRGRTWTILLNLLAAAVLVISLHTVWPGRGALYLGLVLALIDLSISGLALVLNSHWAILLQILIWLLTLMVVTMTLLEAILSAPNVTRDTIVAALCAYILLGLTWAYLYALIEFCFPGTLLQASGDSTEAWSDSLWRHSELARLVSFSFGNLASVNYEGIRIPGPFAHLLACLEALIGRIYLVVLVGRLVGRLCTMTPSDQPAQ